MRTRPIRSVTLALPLLLAVPASPGDGEKDFVAALETVDRMIATGKAKEAKKLLVDAIDKTEGQPWALYHLTEILDDLRRATFWSTNERPDPKAHVSGDLLAWSPASGQIKVRYRPEEKAEARIRTGRKDESGKDELPPALHDFDESDSVLIHPIAFEGPYTIEIDGSRYPGLTDPPRSPGIVVCSTWDRHTIVSFGSATSTAKGSTYVSPKILHVDGSDVTVEAESGLHDIPSGKFQLKVVVASSTITAFSSDDKILTAKKPASVYGRIAFLNLPDVDEIRISGKAQPSWLQGVVDAAIQERWKEFEASYQPSADLPAWLREKAWENVGGKTWTDESMPGAADPSDEARVRGFFDRLKEKGAEEALKTIRSTSGMSPRAVINSWLAAVALRALGREDEALDECAKVCESDPRFLPARRMKVELQIEAAGSGAALEECKKLVSDFPDEPKAHFDLAELELLEGRPEKARDTLRAAIDSGVPAGTLENAEHLVVRAIRGPLWPRAFEYKTRNYVVKSDIDQATCFEAATLLEKFHAKFNIHLRRVPGQESQTFRVFLFSGEEGYLAYARDLFGRERRNTAGLYSPVVKQLLIWNLPDVQQMMRTVRHEGFHQYFDRLVKASPVWFNEGLAEYYEGSKLVRGAWSDGEINSGYLETLRENGLVDLKEFLRVQPWTFYDAQNAERCYAQAWAFVHFLQNGGKEPKRRFGALLDALMHGVKPKDAVARVFDEASLPTIEKDFAAYLAKLE